MESKATQYPHVELAVDGVPFVSGTTVKVVELVSAHLAYGWSPAELHYQYPHLSMGQIHGALAYYWDHKDVLDADIEHRRKLVERLRSKNAPSTLIAKLGRRRTEI